MLFVCVCVCYTEGFRVFQLFITEKIGMKHTINKTKNNHKLPKKSFLPIFPPTLSTISFFSTLFTVIRSCHLY